MAKLKDKKANKLDTVKTTATDLLEQLGVSATVECEQSEENIILDIKSEDHKGLLIGNRGETLAAFQTILNLFLKNKTGEWHNVVVNVGDWREKQEDYLTSLAKQAKTRAQETGKPQNLYNLTPSQRRVVHTFFADDSEVESFSEGEGRDRYLVIKLKDGKDKAASES